MSKNIVVMGMGMISAIGLTVDEAFDSLINEKSGIDTIKYLDTIHKSDFLLGEVKLSNEALFEKLEISQTESKKHTRTSLLALSAAREAVANSGFESENWNSKRVGIISATSVGGMDKTELDYGDKNFSSGFLKTHLSGDSTDVVADDLNINHYRTTLSTACSSAANAVMHGARLIKQGIIDVAVVGGVDPLSKFTLNGFNSLMILDREWCKPFDADRKGLNLGEAAAFLVIESEESAMERGATVLANLSGYANSNDAYHQTASSPEGEGATISMSKALKMSGLNSDDIDYINVHGTGTNNNDLSEGVAIKRVFGENIPPFSSTKSYTGHTLGAAAAVEAVISLLSMKNSVIFPNLNFSKTIEKLGISPIIELKKEQNISHVLSNSFGFGGNNSTLIFSNNSQK